MHWVWIGINWTGSRRREYHYCWIFRTRILQLPLQTSEQWIQIAGENKAACLGGRHPDLWVLYFICSCPPSTRIFRFHTCQGHWMKIRRLRLVSLPEYTGAFSSVTLCMWISGEQPKLKSEVHCPSPFRQAHFHGFPFDRMDRASATLSGPSTNTGSLPIFSYDAHCVLAVQFDRFVHWVHVL